MEARQIARSKLGNRMMPEWDAIHADDFKLAVAMDSGDEATVNQMLFEKKREMVREALADNFDTSVKTTGELNERGKLQAKAKQIHGKSNSPESINAYLMTFDSMRDGPIRDDIESLYDQKLREAAQEVLTSNAIYNLSKPGLRGSPADLSKVNRDGRAGDRVVDHSYGVDRNTGALIAGMPTEGGHSDNFPHEAFPEFSNARWNMGTEQKYINKSKGNRTGEDAQIAMRNSLKNRMRKDETGDIIRSVANGWQVGEGYGVMKDDMTSPKSMRESLASQAVEAQAMKDSVMNNIIKRVGRDELRNYDNLVRQNGGDDRQVTINADTVILEKAINGNGKRRR